MLRNPATLLRELPSTVRILVAGTFINKTGSFIIPFLTIVLKREFHLTSGQVGALVMAYGAGSLVSVLAGGVTTDRHTLDVHRRQLEAMRRRDEGALETILDEHFRMLETQFAKGIGRRWSDLFGARRRNGR